MGCAYSTEEADEVLWRCKERRRLMKQLLGCRAELAAAHIAYLRSLKDTGATLRYLTEVETMIHGSSPPRALRLPTSPPPPPPPPLPPSPPPPRSFSPVVVKKMMADKLTVEDQSDGDEDEICFLPPPPPPFVSEWDSSDHLGSPAFSGSSSPVPQKDGGVTAPQAPELVEDWVDTDSEIGEEEEVVHDDEEDELIRRKEALALAMSQARGTYPPREFADDTSSVVSRFTKDTDMSTMVRRSKKTLAGIVKELDDYFLKAAAGGEDVAVLLEPNHSSLQLEGLEAKKGKNSKSAKVVNVLSWNWSFRSSTSNRDAQDAKNSTGPGTHCTTLEKILAEEQKLYRQVKDEESATTQHKKVTLVLQKLEADYDWAKRERTLQDIEELQCRIISLKESINETCLSISRLRDEELFPQLIEFSIGLLKMWRTMYECHQVQNHVSQQANLLDSSLGTDPTTSSHRHAISQLEAEVTAWYSSFHNLFCCQREYARILHKWVRLTDCLPENNTVGGSTTSIYGFCEELQGALDRLPDKVAAETIKTFLLVIRAIMSQHTEEYNLQRKSDRLQSRLDKELRSLWSSNHDEHRSRDPPALRPSSTSKHAKVEALKKKVEEEKAMHRGSIRTSRAMMLNNLQTSLPNVFQALTGFSRMCVQELEGIGCWREIVTSLSESVSPAH